VKRAKKAKGVSSPTLPSACECENFCKTEKAKQANQGGDEKKKEKKGKKDTSITLWMYDPKKKKCTCGSENKYMIMHSSNGVTVGKV